MKMDVKSKEWDRSNMEEGQDGSNFCFCSKDVVGGSNSDSGKF